MTALTTETLTALFARKIAGEKTKALATEVGLTMQGLMGAFKTARLCVCNNCGQAAVDHKDGMCEACTKEFESCPADDITEQSEWDAAPEDTSPLDHGACETPSEEPTPEPVAPVVEPVAATEPVVVDAKPVEPVAPVVEEPKPEPTPVAKKHPKVRCAACGTESHTKLGEKCPTCGTELVAAKLPEGEELKKLYDRHTAGEKLGPLAKEAGCSWNRLWVLFDQMKKAAVK